MRQAVIAGVALLAGAAMSCARRTDSVASRYIKSVRVVASHGARITVTRAESTELAGAALDISAGALKRDATITLELGYEPILSAHAESAGDVAVWGPEGTTFLRPVSLTIPYRLGAGRRAQDLYVESVDGSGERQRFDQRSLTVDQSARTATLAPPTLASFQAGARATGESGPEADAGPRDGPAPVADAAAEDTASSAKRCTHYCAALLSALEANACAPAESTCLDRCEMALAPAASCAAETAQLYDCAATRPAGDWRCGATDVVLAPGICSDQQSALDRCRML